jgi:hypothetical protein
MAGTGTGATTGTGGGGKGKGRRGRETTDARTMVAMVTREVKRRGEMTETRAVELLKE